MTPSCGCGDGDDDGSLLLSCCMGEEDVLDNLVCVCTCACVCDLDSTDGGDVIRGEFVSLDDVVFDGRFLSGTSTSSESSFSWSNSL